MHYFQTLIAVADDCPVTEATVPTSRLGKKTIAKPQPCLRTSPLAKQFGWGLAFDQEGRVALCPMESQAYRDMLADERIKVVKAMRSSRG